MAIPARLIEHVAHRLLKTLLSAFPIVKSITVEITKYNPPVNGCMEAAVFTARGNI
jgi:dihydroneopterin aldolase